MGDVLHYDKRYYVANKSNTEGANGDPCSDPKGAWDWNEFQLDLEQRWKSHHRGSRACRPDPQPERLYGRQRSEKGLDPQQERR